MEILRASPVASDVGIAQYNVAYTPQRAWKNIELLTGAMVAALRTEYVAIIHDLLQGRMSVE